MGIKDLLKNFETITKKQHLRDFANKRVAIDASGWLHKALYTVTEDFIDSNFVDNKLYVDQIIAKIRNIESCGLKVVMVFDGKRNNLKSETNNKREEIRLLSIEKGKLLLDSFHRTTDQHCRAKIKSECITMYQRGLSVTQDMEKNCIAGLRKLGIEVIVAPYEADPQLAYLCHIGYCDAVMSEDSDILVYSACCGTNFPILYKLDNKGSVETIDLSLCGVLMDTDTRGIIDENALVSSYDGSQGSDAKISLKGPEGFIHQLRTHFHPVKTNCNNISSINSNSNIQGRRMFVQMCLLAGCDYCESIPSVGLQTALQAVIRFRDTADNQRLKKICDYFKLSGKSVKEQYCSRVLRAEQLFFYHPVYNPNSKDIAYFINPNISCSSCDDDRYKIRDECGLVGDLSIHTDDGDNRSSSYPMISMNELLKLGGTAQEVIRLLPQPHNSSNKQKHHSEDLSICNVKQSNSSSSSIAIKDVCEGVYYIKDHEYIQPNFPWHNLASNGLRSTCSNAAKSLRHELMRSVNHLHHVIQTQSDSKYVQKSLSFPSSLSTAMLTNMTQGVVSSDTCDNNQFAPSFNKPQSAHNIYTSSVQMNKAVPAASKRSYQEAFSTYIPIQPSTTSICVPTQPSTSIGKKLDIFQSFKYCRQQQSDYTPNYRQSTVITIGTCKRQDEATIVTPSVDDVDDGGVVNRDDVSDHLSDVLLPSTVKKELPMECTVYDLTGDDTTHRTIEVAGRNDDLQIAVASDYSSVMLFDERQHGHWTGKLDDKENELQCQLSVYDLVVDSDRADNDDCAKHHDNTSAASSTVYITPDPLLRRQSTTEPLKTTKSLLNHTNNRIRIGTNIVTATKRKTMGLLKPSSFLANTAMGDSDHGDHSTDSDTPSSKLMTNIQQTQKMHIPSAKSIHHSSSSSSGSSASPASNKNKRGRVDTLTRRGSLGGTASIRSFFQRVI